MQASLRPLRLRAIVSTKRAIQFQFPAEFRCSDRIDYTLETVLTLDKTTGHVSCDLSGLAHRRAGGA